MGFWSDLFYRRFHWLNREDRGQPFELWVDRETGVNYLFRWNGQTGGLTVLVDPEGKPVVSLDWVRKPSGKG